MLGIRRMTVQTLRQSRVRFQPKPTSKGLRSASTVADDHALVSPFRPWSTPKIESDGDYRKEAWLEKHIGGPLYEEQDSLPRLPIPSVSDTLKRFLPTALPLAQSHQEANALKTAVEKFPLQAEQLQERLLERQKEFHNSSW